MPVCLSDRELLSRLVSCDSVSAKSNLPIAQLLLEYLKYPGVRVTEVQMEVVDKLNLVLELGPEPADGGGLALSGHMDVVPAREPEWESNPFELQERGGQWYGRGTCDMKAFIALAANIFRNVDVRTLKQPLVLILTCDEEIGSRGAQRLASVWPRDHVLPRNVLIGEPTSLRAVRMHKGHLTLRVRVKGHAAHSGSPHLGKNAIEAALPLLQRLNSLRTQFETVRLEASGFFTEVPYPVLNIAQVQGGEALNVVPDSCAIGVGVRLLPGQDTAAAIDAVDQIVCESRKETEADMSLEILNDNPPLLTPESAHLHQVLCQELGQARSYGVSFASDGGPMRREFGMECVLFGPGTIEVAHKPNEHVAMAECERARGVLERLVRIFCMS